MANMEEEKSRTNSLIEWARKNHTSYISIRVARKYLEDDIHFWMALGEARTIHRSRYGSCDVSSRVEVTAK